MHFTGTKILLNTCIWFLSRLFVIKLQKVEFKNHAFMAIDTYVWVETIAFSLSVCFVYCPDKALLNGKAVQHKLRLL